MILSAFNNKETPAKMRFRVKAHPENLRSCELSPDKSLLLTTSESHDIRACLWNINTGELDRKLECGEYFVQLASFSPDGERVIAGSSGKNARIWDIKSCTPTAGPLCHEGWMHSAFFIPDGTRVVTTSCAPAEVRIWNAVTSKLEIDIAIDECLNNPCAVSPDGSVLLTNKKNGEVVSRNILTGEILYTVDDHSDCVLSMTFSPLGEFFVTTSQDHTTKIWKTLTGELVHTLKGHRCWVTSACFSNSGDRLVTTSQDRTACIWDAHNGLLLRKLSDHQASVWGALFSPDGKIVITTSSGRSDRFWDADTGNLLFLFESGIAERTRFFFLEKTILAVSHDQGNLTAWEIDADRMREEFVNQ